MAVIYDDHAAFQIARRGIDKASIEATLADPDAVERSEIAAGPS